MRWVGQDLASRHKWALNCNEHRRRESRQSSQSASDLRLATPVSRARSDLSLIPIATRYGWLRMENLRARTTSIYRIWTLRR